MLLAALVLSLQQPATTPPPRPDLTYGFTTERLEIEFDSPSSRLRWTGDQHDPDPTRPTNALVLECSRAAPAVCVLCPVHVEGMLELFVGASARMPDQARLSIEARTSSDYYGKEGAAWVRAFELGNAGDEALTDRPAQPATIERVGGHVRMLATSPYLQLRLTAHSTSETPVAVSIQQICWAGYDRTRACSRPWPPVGGCGLVMGDWSKEESRMRALSREPHSLNFFAAPEPELAGMEASSAAACLAMLLPRMQVEDPARRLLPRMKTMRGFVEPGGWLSIVKESGGRGTMECYSIWPEVEMVLGGGGPFAIRVQDSAGSLRWIVLSSFDDKQNALVYDPSSKEQQPLRWTRDELEQRWFGAGGLAFACRR